jgi:hypothetical protein
LSNWGLHPDDDPLKILQRLSFICHVSAQSRSALNGERPEQKFLVD